jgi:hypothetical protein
MSAGGGVVDLELEEIQSALQERTAQVIKHKTGDGPRIVSDNSDHGSNPQILKVSPRRPSFLQQPAPQLDVASAERSLKEMSLDDLAKLEEMCRRQREARDGSDAAAPIPAPLSAPVSAAAAAAPPAEAEDDGRGRPRADSIGPEIRRAQVLARHEAARAEAVKGAAQAPEAAKEKEPSSSDADKEKGHEKGRKGEEGKEFSPERTGTEGRPGAPIDKMFASFLGGVPPSRQGEVSEGLANRERAARNEEGGGAAPKPRGGIGAMIENDKTYKAPAEQASACDVSVRSTQN